MASRCCGQLGHSGTHHAVLRNMDERACCDADARLKRIAGQVAGLQRMLSEDRYCGDVLLQVAAVRAALAEVGKVVLTSHIQTCLSDALKSRGSKDQRAKLDDLMDVFARYCAVAPDGRALKPRLGRSK
jgi:CsoR family transcriptional regulator, copper-sensing transcriptional repressor